MQALRVVLLFVVLIAFGAGCNDSRSVKFTNVEGLASIRSGTLLRVWAYAKECKEEEKPETLREFPFVYRLFDSESCQGSEIFAFAVSDRKLLTGKEIIVRGKWTKTGSISYLRVRKSPAQKQTKRDVRNFPPEGACNSPLFLAQIFFFC